MNKIKTYLNMKNINYNLFNNYFKKLTGYTVYIGFSGGADSTCILYLANHFKKIYKLNVKAINFEHGIRGKESIDDSNWCKQLCKSLNIPIDVISLSIPHDCKNIEAVAREKRLNYYKNLINKNNEIILLGHHYNDLLETFFIRLARGSNLSGLFGLKDKIKIDKLCIGRPLLNYNKTQIIDFLKNNDIIWRTDSTNLQNDYSRNYIRNVILPNWFKQNQFIEGGIRTSIKNLESDLDFIEQYVDEQYEKEFKNQKHIHIDVFKKYHNAIKFRLLKKFIEQNNCYIELSRGLFEQFEKMLYNYDNTDHKKLKLNNEYQLIIKGYNIFIEHFN